MKRKTEKDKNHDRYKKVCEGVWEKRFDTRQSIQTMSIVQLQKLSIQAQYWIDKTKNCYESRIRHRNIYYKNKPDPNHEPPIRQAKSYNKSCEQFKDKVDKLLYTRSTETSTSNRNSYDDWSVVSSTKRKTI